MQAMSWESSSVSGILEGSCRFGQPPVVGTGIGQVSGEYCVRLDFVQMALGSLNAARLTSDLLFFGWIPRPHRMRRCVLTLHQEGIGIDKAVVVEHRAIVNEGAWADGASLADSDSIRLEDAIFQRMTLQYR